MSSNRLSDRGFTASRGLSYTFTGTATEFDAALPLSHGLGALPGALELWVEVSAGQWEQHDPATYVTASTTALTTTGTTLASVVGGSTNVRLVASSGAVAVSVEEATQTKAGIVGTGAQTFGGVKTFASDPVFTSGSQLVTGGTQTISGAKTFSDNANFGGNLTLNNATPARLNFLDVNHPYIIGDRFGLSTRGGLLFKAYNGGEIDAGQFNHTGAWQLGPSSGLTTTHVIQNAWNGGTGGVLQLNNTNTSASPQLAFASGGTDRWSLLSNNTGTTFSFYSNLGTVTAGTITSAGAWQLGPGTPADGVSHSLISRSDTTDSSGIYLINTTPQLAASAIAVRKTGNTQEAAGNRFITFYAGSSGCGGIQSNGTNTAAFFTFSDERLKKDIVPLSGMLEKVCQLQPSEFTFKGRTERQIQIIAQSMESMFPQYVTEGKYADEAAIAEGVDPELNYKQVVGWDAADAILVSAIKELNAKVEAQAAEIAALKGAN